MVNFLTLFPALSRLPNIAKYWVFFFKEEKENKEEWVPERPSGDVTDEELRGADFRLDARGGIAPKENAVEEKPQPLDLLTD